MEDKVLRDFVYRGRIASQALGTVTTGNVAWAKAGKTKVLSSAS
ncbi:hypothetical protein EMIT0111MI5_170043 [Burkholderia sp. IT-111MI5]